MEQDFDRADTSTVYRTLSGAVVPRPIGWISTTGEDGVDNLAPYSFFNVVSVDPPVVMFAPVDGEDGLKHTTQNVVDTEEFVVNVVTADLAEAMNATSATLPAEKSEFDHADLTRAPSTTVAPPRVAEAPVHFECTLYDFVDVGISSLVLGEVAHAHLADEVTTGEKLDVDKLDALGRLAGSAYTYTRDRFEMERPP